MPDQTDLAECTECLCLASRRAARAITRAYDQRLRRHGLRATQFTILVMLLQRGPSPIGALAEALGVERTTLTRNLALIEATGWASIRPGEDARSRLVAITSKGRAAVAAALPGWRTAQRATAAAIGGTGVRAVRALARRTVG